MPTNINADNGVVSGIPGLKTSADNSGVLALQTNGTTALTVNASQAIGVGSTPSYGTSGQVLTSAGSGASPTWTTISGSSQWTTSGSNIYYTTGAVQVGSTLNNVDSTTNIFQAVGTTALGNVFIGTSSAFSSGNGGGQLRLGKVDSGSLNAFGAIEGSPSDPTSGNNGLLIFKTSDGSKVLQERSRIDSSGNLLVGVTSGNGRIRMKQSADSHSNTFTIENFGNTNAWSFLIGSDNNLYFGYNGTSRGVFNNSTGAYTTISDRSLKKDISEIQYGLNSVLALRPVSYFMKDQEEGASKTLGFIAQEVNEVVPESVFQMRENLYGMDKNVLIPVLVKAIQELKAEFDAYKASHP